MKGTRKMLNVAWIKSTQNDWLRFETFNLSSVVKTVGVYVIWHTGQPPWTVKAGQGDIAERLGVHRNDPRILAYRSYGAGLFVTWAAVQTAYLNGVERYLGDQLRPLVAERFPDVAPIPVNLPWAA
jgi:hypothetical protein